MRSKKLISEIELTKQNGEYANSRIMDVEYLEGIQRFGCVDLPGKFYIDLARLLEKNWIGYTGEKFEVTELGLKVLKEYECVT